MTSICFKAVSSTTQTERSEPGGSAHTSINHFAQSSKSMKIKCLLCYTSRIQTPEIAFTNVTQ